jgi:hypothetical protein
MNLPRRPHLAAAGRRWAPPCDRIYVGLSPSPTSRRAIAARRPDRATEPLPSRTSAGPSRCRRPVARYSTGPRSAWTVRRSPSTAAFSTFRSARAFASDRELVGKSVALGLPSRVVSGAERGDRRRVQGAGAGVNLRQSKQNISAARHRHQCTVGAGNTAERSRALQQEPPHGGLQILVKGVLLQRVRSRAGQVPNQTRRRVIELDVAADGMLRHGVNDHCPESLPLRR